MKSTLIRKRGSIALVSLLAVAIVGLPSAAGAAPGDLDPSFGVGGKVVTDFGGTDNAQAVLLQPNSKTIVAGSTSSGGTDFALARYTKDGALDPIFGGDGMVTTDFGGGDVAWGLAFRPGGGIVAAGNTNGGPAVARYRWDGSLDPTFDGDGKSTPGLEGIWYDVALQVDGKIVIVGCKGCLGGNSDFIVGRLNANGSIDQGFGEQGGWTETNFDAGDNAFAVAIQNDGRIVVGGWTGETPDGDFALARYNQNGVLDPTFDGDGKVTIDFGGLEHAYALAIQSDGKIVVAGESRDGSGDYDFALARLNVDGSLDTQGLDRYMDAPFGVGGKVTTDFNGGEDEALSVAIESSGKIVLAGLAEPNPSTDEWDFGLARYNVDGSLDSSFGIGGKVVTSLTGSDDIALSLVLQRDGRIVGAGTAGDGTSTADFGVTRYLVRPCCTAEGSPPGGPPDPGPLP